MCMGHRLVVMMQRGGRTPVGGDGGWRCHMVYWWWEVAVTFLKQGVCDFVDLHPAGLENLHELAWRNRRAQVLGLCMQQ